VCVCVCMLGCL